MSAIYLKQPNQSLVGKKFYLQSFIFVTVKTLNVWLVFFHKKMLNFENCSDACSKATYPEEVYGEVADNVINPKLDLDSEADYFESDPDVSYEDIESEDDGMFNEWKKITNSYSASCLHVCQLYMYCFRALGELKLFFLRLLVRSIVLVDVLHCFCFTYIRTFLATALLLTFLHCLCFLVSSDSGILNLFLSSLNCVMYRDKPYLIILIIISN